MRNCAVSWKSVLKVWESVLNVEKVCKKLRKYEKVCKKLRKCAISWESVLNVEKACKKLRKNEKSWESVLKDEKVWKIMLKDEKVWESVLKVEKVWVVTKSLTPWPWRHLWTTPNKSSNSSSNINNINVATNLIYRLCTFFTQSWPANARERETHIPPYLHPHSILLKEWNH